MNGTCLCGAISIVAENHNEVTICHCGICRRWGGGPMHSIHCGSNVQITGTESLTVYRSSEWAERAFCSKCGTHVYYRLVPANEYIVPAGLFQSGLEPKLTRQIFIDGKPAYYEFANDTEKLTEAQVFAMYAPS